VISVLALDIDGVLTDGKVRIDEQGRESKTLSYRDIDAIFRAQRSGLSIVLITGETSPWVDMIARRLEATHVYQGAKEKEEALKNLCHELGVELSQVCYVGDSQRDVAALTIAGLGLAPADAHHSVKAAADRVLQCAGGNGAVAEAVEALLEMQK
jgi:3-deoxy-D-manno-octulosonate 8-phosphate phosphatase (KDO 8-P phosphatase)